MAAEVTENKAETTLGRVLVDQGLVTRQELDDCRAMKAELEKENPSDRTLGGVLIANGFLTPTQLARAKQAAEDTTKFQQIPGYQILSELGAGAMARVYKARQISLDRIVAVKILPKRMSADAEFVRRFYYEGKAAAKLNHPNIVGAFDVGEANGYHYFVMEYVEGASVWDRLDKGEAYSEKESLKIIIEVCRALVHAHAIGLIHRDVKPKNIMLTREGNAKLADMGLAREASDTEAAQAEAGKAYGTPYYISPEQIRGELNIDARADIYSLGATFYHMITGRVPFDAPTPSAVMHKHLREDLVPPDHIVSTISSGVGEIIEIAMAKKAADRYPTAQDMLNDLERVERGEQPLFAGQNYDLNSLANVEANAPDSVAMTLDQRTGYRRAFSMQDRVADPMFLGLIAIAILELLIILFLAMRH
jgi:serine/threonine protein kinase